PQGRASGITPTCFASPIASSRTTWPRRSSLHGLIRPRGRKDPRESSSSRRSTPAIAEPRGATKAKPAERRLLCHAYPRAFALVSCPLVRLLVPLCPLLAALSALGCAARIETARGCPKGCEAGRICVVGRCRSPDEPPSPPDTLRLILEPINL